MQYILTLTRTTKNTYRYDHSNEEADLRTVYVQKIMFPRGAPDRITVTIDPTD